MPHSLILNLLPQSTIYPQFLTGRHYHALFLNLVSSVDRTLGDILHDSTADKAFTLSPLQVKLDPPRYTDRKYTDKKYIDKRKIHVLQYQQQKPINSGTPCWWRISLLDDTLFGKLTQLWLNINPEQPWHLGSADLFITSIQGTPQSIQPWANACSYSQLYDRASNTEKTITFVFATPTAFRQGSYDSGLPTRDLVFRSLLKRWNKYSGIEFDSEFIESIYPSFFNIKTEIASDSRSKFIGCVGEISYRIMGNVDAEAIKKINTLADFALYAGVGRKTPMGMGMVRRI
ncbi:CRISPR-associated endoribonuclease Cas6 [Mastigocoleus testarum]|uniref:CRISPR-associated protein Cas6 n=1 Tax=Mastigocoleus testarum BC008 TaxID=371196 RepID=A0A0V7ZTV9_9CYAN|nr:CRISPR-associated endoribonuclease Cas6 [Mastigocoleus testarum]KST67902.1 CRISPR-associated protein Cas6 [Mastigocoleus testarum BC008]